MKLKTLISLFLALSFAISCSKVSFSNTPSTACQDASQCVVNVDGETLFQNLVAPAQNTQVDILFIVDNSMSMVQIQQNLAAHFPGFIQSLGSLNWRIAIATTDTTSLDTSDSWINSLPQYLKDHKNGNLVPFLIPSGSGFTRTSQYFIDSTTSNAQALFSATIQRPETNFCASYVRQYPQYQEECYKLISGDERGIYAAIKNVTGQNPNNFIRPSASLHVIVVSNEDERSNGGGFIPQNSTPQLQIPAPGYPIVAGQDNPQDFAGLFNGTSKVAKFHTIGQLPPTGTNFENCVGAQFKNITSEDFNSCFYIQTSNLTNGVVENINTSNYTPALANIATNIQDTSIKQFTMNCVPTSVIIHKDGSTPLPPGYFDGQSLNVSSSTIYFSPVISPNTGLTLEWTCPNH